MGSASRLRDGNQAKKAQLFKVSVFGSHAGPGSAKTDSFLCSPFLGPPPTSSLSGVVAGTGIELGTGYPKFVDHEVDGAFVGRPPAVTPIAVSGWGPNWMSLSCRVLRCKCLAARMWASSMFTICSVTSAAVDVFLGGGRAHF